jgi:hypothetical protein
MLRGTAEDHPAGPRERQSAVRSVENEAIVAAFRRQTLQEPAMPCSLQNHPNGEVG